MGFLLLWWLPDGGNFIIISNNGTLENQKNQPETFTTERTEGKTDGLTTKYANYTKRIGGEF